MRKPKPKCPKCGFHLKKNRVFYRCYHCNSVFTENEIITEGPH